MILHEAIEAIRAFFQDSEPIYELTHQMPTTSRRLFGW
jgi:hypothetical protein